LHKLRGSRLYQNTKYYVSRKHGLVTMNHS